MGMDEINSHSSALTTTEVQAIEAELVSELESTSVNLDLFLEDRAQKIKDLELELNETTAEVRKQQGIYLLEVKGRLSHGDFQHWLRDNFSWSPRTARRYMAEAKRTGLSVLEETPEPRRKQLSFIEPAIEAEITETSITNEPVYESRSQSNSYQEADSGFESDLTAGDQVSDLTASDHCDRHVDRSISDSAAVITPEPEYQQDESFGMALDNPDRYDDHWTPQYIIDSVLTCFQPTGIDLDPCAETTDVGHNVPAREHFEIADDGLSKLWWGKVYCNPPYSGNVKGNTLLDWAHKIAHEIDQESVEEIIVLAPSYNGEKWFQVLAEKCLALCLVHPRIKFVGNSSSARFSSTIFYLGSNLANFYHAFKTLGMVVMQIEPEMFGG
jgi:hypothetical protein